MTKTHLLRLYLTFVIVKGVTLAIAATLLNVGFWRALVLLVISATITGLFALLVAREQSRENRQLHDRLDRLEQTGHDIAGKVGADKRKTDPGNGGGE